MITSYMFIMSLWRVIMPGGYCRGGKTVLTLHPSNRWMPPSDTPAMTDIQNDMMKRFFNIKKSDRCTTIFLYGDIGSEVESGQIAAELAACSGESERIDVRINSYGGDVFSGIAIYNTLRQSKADIHLYVDGVAASMASVIALCGKPVEMSRYARLMLHSVSGGCYGNKKDMAKCIEEIESLEDSLSDIYSHRMNLTKEEVKARYFDGEDHWLRAEEALAMGLIDGIYDAGDVSPDSTTEDVYTIFQNRLTEPQKHNHMTFEELKQQPLFKDCKTEDEIVEKVRQFAGQAGQLHTLTEENNSLKAKLKVFEDKAAEAAEAERKRLLDEAERDGRINAETRPTFENILKNNPDEGQKVLAALTPARRVLKDLHVEPGGSESAWDVRMKQIREARAARQYK